MIRTIDLNKIFGLGETEIKALTDINIDIKKGDFVSIQGPSGCGKSTLLNMLGCLDRPTNGGVFIEGKDVTKLGDNSLAKIRRDKIGFVFQKYNLISTLNAIENVKLPMMFSGINMAVRTEKAKSLLELVGIGHRLESMPAKMSGGEQQRVAIARALANDPPLIIGDELTGNLDTKTGKMIMDIMVELNNKGKTLIIVTHDPKVASMSKRSIRMVDGVIIDDY